MRVIRKNLRLPKSALQALAVVGWAGVLYLAYVLGLDSWERTLFSIEALTQELPEMDPFQQRYVDHPVLTLFHTLPGLLFLALGSMQFVAPIRRRIPKIHRMSGRVFLVIAMSVGVAAIVMTFRFPIFGMTFNQGIGLVFGAFMLFAFSKAFIHVRAGRYPRHREWMIRGFATGLGVAIFRVLLNDVLPKMGFEFMPAWNTAMVLCFPILIAVAEFWIWATQPKVKLPVSTPEAATVSA
jgi:uncharacterized membrane protein